MLLRSFISGLYLYKNSKVSLTDQKYLIIIFHIIFYIILLTVFNFIKNDTNHNIPSINETKI